MNKFKFFLLLLLIAISSINGCRKNPSEAVVGVGDLRLNHEEIEQLKEKSKTGDKGDAAYKLAMHYLFCECDYQSGDKWLEVAVSQGNSKAKSIYQDRHRLSDSDNNVPTK